MSTIKLITHELSKQFQNNKEVEKDIELLTSQVERCNDILKKLTLNPTIDDDFIDSNLTLYDYISEIVRSFQKISKKEFSINYDLYKKAIKTSKSPEIMYGLRNFIGNANKFSKKKVEIFLYSDNKNTEVIFRDDCPGFPKDLID